VRAVELSEDGRRASVRLADMVACDQLVLELRVPTEAGGELREEVFLTVHRVPAR